MVVAFVLLVTVKEPFVQRRKASAGLLVHEEVAWPFLSTLRGFPEAKATFQPYWAEAKGEEPRGEAAVT